MRLHQALGVVEIVQFIIVPRDHIHETNGLRRLWRPGVRCGLAWRLGNGHLLQGLETLTLGNGVEVKALIGSLGSMDRLRGSGCLRCRGHEMGCSLKNNVEIKLKDAKPQAQGLCF